MMPSDWDRLFDAFSTGNDQDLYELYQKLDEYLLRAAYKCVESKPELAPDMPDCVQEALLAIWQAIVKRSGPQDHRATQSWCTRIVINKVLDLLRKRGYSIKPAATDDPKPRDRLNTLDEDVVSPGDMGMDVQQKIDYSEAIRLIFTNPHLTGDERTILWLGWKEEIDDSAIADSLGIARATVRVKRMRALQKLRADPELLRLLDLLFRQ